MRRAALIVALMVAGVAGACDKGPPGSPGDLVSAWKKAGLDVGEFGVADGKGIGATSCTAGKVAGIETTVCEFADAETAKKGEKAGLVTVGDATGASLAQGKVLLVLADRTKADPNGKKMKEIVTTFRNR